MQTNPLGAAHVPQKPASQPRARPMFIRVFQSWNTAWELEKKRKHKDSQRKSTPWTRVNRSKKWRDNIETNLALRHRWREGNILLFRCIPYTRFFQRWLVSREHGYLWVCTMRWSHSPVPSSFFFQQDAVVALAFHTRYRMCFGRTEKYEYQDGFACTDSLEVHAMI